MLSQAWGEFSVQIVQKLAPTQRKQLAATNIDDSRNTDEYAGSAIGDDEVKVD